MEASSSFILLVVVLGQVSGPRCDVPVGLIGWVGLEVKQRPFLKKK